MSTRILNARLDDDLAIYRKVLNADEFRALELWILHGFWNFQREWLLESSQLAICCKARQIGTSYTTAGVLVLWGAFHGEMTTVISKGQTEADEVLDKCARHINVLLGLNSKLASTISISKKEIVFASGGRILALPSTGGRSFSGNVFLDEFAYQQHATQVWDNAAPVTTLGNHKMRVVSTPNGVGNEFHQLWEHANGASNNLLPEEVKKIKWATHLIPMSRAIEEGYPVDIAKCWALAKGDPRVFSQFFDCNFLDAVLQYIGTEKIDACKTLHKCIPDDRGLYYAGLDIGREVDNTCLVVVLQTGSKIKPVHIETMPRTDSDGLEAMIDWAFERYNLQRLCIDSTGLGTFPAERIQKKHGDRVPVKHRRNRVECVDFGLKSKEALATNLYTYITDQTLLLPEGDAQLPHFIRRNKIGNEEVGEEKLVNRPGEALQLRKEIASIRRVITPNGNVTYDTPRTKEGHGDRAWALALAAFGCDKVHPMLAALQAGLGINQ